jgi:hypothetical protein
MTPEEEYKRIWKNNGRSVEDLINEWAKSRWQSVIRDELLTQSYGKGGFAKYIANGLKHLLDVNTKTARTRSIPEEMYTISSYHMDRFSIKEWFDAIKISDWHFSGLDDPDRCREAVFGVDSLGMPVPEATLFPAEWQDLLGNSRKYNYARMIIRKFIEYLRTQKSAA